MGWSSVSFHKFDTIQKAAEKNISRKTAHSSPEQGRHFASLLEWPICCSLPRMSCQYCLPHAVA